MKEENEFRDLPIERSVILLGAISGAVLYIFVALFANNWFMNASGWDAFRIAAAFSG